MNRPKRTLLTIIGIIACIVIIGSFFVNSIAEKKIASLIKEKLPAHIENSFHHISVNILNGSISFDKPVFTIKIKDSTLIQSNFKMESLTVKGFSYWDYLINDQLHVKKITFTNLQATHYKDRLNKSNDSTTKGDPLQLKKPIIIDQFILKNTSVRIIDNTKDSLYLSVEDLNLKVLDIKLDSTSSIKTFKNSYKAFEISTDYVFFKSGLYDNLTIDHFEFSNNSVSIFDLRLQTKYSKKEFSRIISTERDHYNIEAESINFSPINYGFENETFYFSSNLLTIDNTLAEIYRDKLVADDFKTKNLYSKSLRELPFNLTIDSASIKNSTIIYQEKNHAERPPGVLTINNIDANASNLSNTYLAPEKTIIIVDAVFMKSTPFHANWNFDINDKDDSFEFEADIGVIYGESLNTLLVPLINAKIDGEIDETIFTITGNSKTSMIYMSQKYDDVKINILNKKKKKNVLVSGVANVFVHKESRSKGELYNHITTNATRDNTKSFFNYLTRNLKEALLVSFFEKKNKKYTKHKVHIDHKKNREARLKKKEHN